MSARPLPVYEPDDDHLVVTRRAATILTLVPTPPEPHPAAEFVPDPRYFRAWKQQAVAPVRYAACLTVYAQRNAATASAVVPVAPAVAVAPAAALANVPTHAPVAAPAAPSDSPTASPRPDGVIFVDLAGMTVSLHGPELPVIEHQFDVVEYTRAVVAAAFAEVGAVAA